MAQAIVLSCSRSSPQQNQCDLDKIDKGELQRLERWNVGQIIRFWAWFSCPVGNRQDSDRLREDTSGELAIGVGPLGSQQICSELTDEWRT